MILVRLMGGLGNQMFQYATAKSVAQRNNSTLKIDCSLLEDAHYKPDNVVTHRKLDLDVFDLNYEFASNREIEYFNGAISSSLVGKALNKIRYYFRKRNLVLEEGRGFNQEILNLKDNKCLVGGWQSPKYFQEFSNEIKELYTFKEVISEQSLALKKKINQTNSVAIHIRRKDYISSPLYSKTIGALNLNYYVDAIERIKSFIEDPTFFIFSDDIDWCYSTFEKFENIEFVSVEHNGYKNSNSLQLMMNCRHFVISNSTFSWWAAWLGNEEDSIVIAPQRWARSKEHDPIDIIPENWTRIENGFEEL